MPSPSNLKTCLLQVAQFDIIQLPEVAEGRVSGYLVEMIGNMSSSYVQRLTTGSSVLTVPSLTVQFNRLSGLARRPIAHTCSCVLVCYTNYSDFHSEWMSILNDPELCWFMDSI